MNQQEQAKKQWLVAIYNTMELVEGTKIKIDGKLVTVEHITMTGFLYTKQTDDTDEVSVVINGKSYWFYKNWDYLEFVPCDVEYRYE